MSRNPYKDDEKNDKPDKPVIGKTNMEFIRNVFTYGNGGRPRKYDSAEELQKRIIEYFEYCEDNKIKILTISGLVLFCGFSDRKSFYAYEDNPKFSHTIKTAREMMVQYYEQKGQTDAFPTFAIFALKNLGWTAEENIKVERVTTEFWVGGDPDVDDQAKLDEHKEYTDYEETTD